MSARTALADALTAALPDVRVIGYTADVDAVTRPTVMLWASRVERTPLPGRLAVTFDLWAVIGGEDPARADDALDDLLDDVVAAVHELPWVEFQTAERGVLYERWHGWKLTLLAGATIGV